MKGDLRYTPSTIFETFPLPDGLQQDTNESGESNSVKLCLEDLGERLDNDRRDVMKRLNMGLTTLYNLYHDPDLSPALVVKTSKCTPENAEWAIQKFTALRELHREIDKAVRDAYGWNEVALDHGFHELEFLQENDRVRYTISNAARKLILQKLLELNHRRHEEEVAAGLVDEKGKILKKKNPGSKGKARKATEDAGQGDLF